MPFPEKIRHQVTVSSCKDPANGYKQKYTVQPASRGCEVSSILFTRADIYSSFILPWRSLLKTWPSTIPPHPAQATQLLSHKTNNVLQLWLTFLLHVIWANLLPSHAQQLAPSGLTCFLRTFWGLHQFSTNTALCLCPEVSRSASCWGWGAGAIALHKIHLAPVFGLSGNPVQEANGVVEQNELEMLPTMAAAAAAIP